MSEQNRIEPEGVVQAVERYVESELLSAEKYDNREPLDDSGVWSLHTLAAKVYAMGWEDGERSAERRAQYDRSRAADRRRRDAQEPA